MMARLLKSKYTVTRLQLGDEIQEHIVPQDQMHIGSLSCYCRPTIQPYDDQPEIVFLHYSYPPNWG